MNLFRTELAGPALARATPKPVVLRYAIDIWSVAIVFAVAGLSLLPFAVPLPAVALVAVMLATIYLRTFCAFIQHNHGHLPVFRTRAANLAFDVVLAQVTGYATAIWELHHNLGHHKHLLDPARDVAAAGTRSRAAYCVRGNLRIHLDAARIGWASKRRARLWKLVAEVCVQLAITALLVAIDPRLALAFFLVPNAITAWLVWWESYTHHLDVPLTTLDDCAITIEDAAYNRATFNIGHHTAHHQKPTLHWSLLPGLTAKIRHRIPASCLQARHATVGARAFAGRTLETPGFRDGLDIAMIGDSTVRDFSIASAPRMLLAQWTRNQNNPFLGRDSVFTQLAQRTSVRATEYATSGASVGPARTWLRRRFQRFANVRTFGEQIAAMRTMPALTLIWIGHNNLDFVTEGRTDAELRAAFRAHFASGLDTLLARAAASPRKHAIVVYGLVDPTSTRHARDAARRSGAFPYLAKTEQRFPPLRAEHGDRLEALSRAISADLAALVAERANPQLIYSACTTQLAFTAAHLHRADGWHASDAGKALLATALVAGLEPALAYLGA